MHAQTCLTHNPCLPLTHAPTPQLDLLAGNAVHAAGSRLDGGVLVDGRPRHMRSFRAISCYVQQKDVLLSSATVRVRAHMCEHLLPFAAHARAAVRRHSFRPARVRAQWHGNTRIPSHVMLRLRRAV